MQTPTLCTKVIHAYIGPTNPSFPLKPEATVQDAPIVEDDGLPRLEFDGEEELGRSEDVRPLPRRAVPFLQGRVVGEHGGRGREAVEIVPPDLHEGGGRRRRDGTRGRRVDEDRVALA